MSRASVFLVMGILAGLSSVVAGQASPTPPASLDENIKNWCHKLSGELRSVNLEKCLARNWKTEFKSQGGYPIPSLYWGDETAKGEGEQRRILILGAMHGDEITAVSTVFRWMDFLERTKADSFLRKNYYLMIPLVNPDGFHANPRTRTNKAGVDINRNFATREWDEKATEYWRKRAKADPRRFPGQKAGSEIETKLVEKAINEFKPDVIVSVHAPYCLVDHDGPIEFPKMQSPLPVRTLGAYPGSLGTYAGLERNIPVVTPELPNAKQLPDLKSIEQLFLFIMKAKF